MMRMTIATAMLCLALTGCGQTSGNKANGAAANGAANAATTNAPVPAPNAAASWGQASAPAPAYRRYFDERWGGTGLPLTPAEVERMLAGQTPQQVVGALWSESDGTNRWTTAARGIAKGDPDWLRVAVRLSAGTDAGTSMDFGIAAGDALTTNPTGALRMLSQIEMGAGACTENGVEVPPEQARAFFEAAIASVENVTDPALQPLKTACIAALREGLQTYPGLNGNAPQPR